MRRSSDFFADGHSLMGVQVLEVCPPWLDTLAFPSLRAEGYYSQWCRAGVDHWNHHASWSAGGAEEQ